MLAAASICTTDVLERHLAPPGFECCERELLGRSWRRDWAMRIFHVFFLRIRKNKWIFAKFQICLTIGCPGSVLCPAISCRDDKQKLWNRCSGFLGGAIELKSLSRRAPPQKSSFHQGGLDAYWALQCQRRK